jgi:DNA polymerase-3 subunit epsilon
MGYTLAFDIESTHLSTEKGRVVSLHMQRRDTGDSFYVELNPGIPIPIESTKVHGITDEKVADAKKFADIVPLLEKAIAGASVLQAFNGSKFDVYMLQAELTRNGSKCSVLKKPLIDDLRGWQEGEPRTLEDASKRWLGKGIEDAHNASADVEAMIAVSDEMRKEFGFDEMTDLEYAAMLKGDSVTPDGRLIWKEGRVTMNWSKVHMGEPVIEVARNDPSFFQFVLSKDGDWLNHGVRSVSINAIRNSTDEEAFNSWVISEFGPPPEKEEEPEKKGSVGGPTPHKIAEAEAEAEAMQNYLETYSEEIAEVEAEHRYNMQQGE